MVKKDNKQVFVLRNCTRTTTVNADNLFSELGYGEVIFVNEDGAIMDTAAKIAASKMFRAVVGTKGKRSKYSDWIRTEDIKSMKSSKFANSVERKYAIGYNGTDGSVDLNVGDKYSMRVVGENNEGFGSEPVVPAYHTVVTSDTQMSVLNTMAVLLSKSYESFDTPPIRINLVTEGTGLADGVEEVTATKGVDSISYTGVVASTGTAPAAGDYIQISGGTALNGEDEPDGVYKVLYIDTTNKTIVLDRPFQNENITDADAEIVDTDDDAGMIIAGNTVELNAIGIEGWYQEDFRVSISGMGDTTFTYMGTGFEAYIGNGRHEQVASMERLHNGTNNPNDYNLEETTLPYQNTDSGHGYSALTIVTRHNQNLNIVEDNSKDSEYVFFLDRGTYANISSDDASTAFGTNLLTGTGVATADGDSFVNVINKIGQEAGILGTGLNTVINGGDNFASDGVFDTGIDF